MTHRDGFPSFSARSAWRGDAGHRKARATPSESLGKPPFRSPERTAGGRRKALPMSHIARGFLPTRRIAHAISRGHYQCSLVLEQDQRDDRSYGGPAYGTEAIFVPHAQVGPEPHQIHGGSPSLF